MYPELFHIGSLTVYTYGLMIAIGIVTAYTLAEKKVKAIGGSTQRLEWLTFSLLAGGFLCSKLLYILTRIQDVAADPSIIFDLSSGWVVYGGIIGGIIGGWLYCKYHNMNFWEYFDLIIPLVALAQGFGRLGCFFAGCCYGIETDSWFSVVFPDGSLAPSHVHLFPTQLVMSAFDFGLYFLLEKLSSHKTFNGEVGAWYLLFYSIGRFLIEFVRGDLIRGGIHGFSTSQIIALIVAACAIAILAAGRKAPAKHSS